MTSQHKNNKDVKHPQVTGKCKFGEKCTRPLTCPYTHNFKNSKKGMGKAMEGHPKSLVQVKLKTHGLMQAHARRLATALRPLLAKFSELKKRAEIAKLDYVDVKSGSSLRDIKELSDSNDSQIAMIKAEAGSIFGNRKIKMRLTAPLIITSTAGGVVNTVTSVIPNGSAEWGAISSLFDDYKVTAVVYHFNCLTVGLAAGAGTTIQGTILCIGYDPDSLAVPGGTMVLTELEQHRLYAITPNASNTITTFNEGKLSEFSLKVPTGVQEDLTAGSLPIAVNASQWQATTTLVSVPYGFIKMYSAAGVSVVTITGVMYIHMEFRLRT